MLVFFNFEKEIVMKTPEEKTVLGLVFFVALITLTLPELVLVVIGNFFSIMQFLAAAIGIVSLVVVAAMAYLHWQYSRKHPGVKTQ